MNYQRFFLLKQNKSILQVAPFFCSVFPDNMTPTSTISMESKIRIEDGFTLIELIVVISLMGLLVFFTLPRLGDNPFLDNSKESSRWLIGKVQMLKESALRQQKLHSLHFDLDSGRIWETNESMTLEAVEDAALNRSYSLPDDLRIIDIEYPNKGKIESGQAEINFYKAGYTDKALVHMQEGDTYMTFLIEPFLANVEFFEEYVGFDH